VLVLVLVIKAEAVVGSSRTVDTIIVAMTKEIFILLSLSLSLSLSFPPLFLKYLFSETPCSTYYDGNLLCVVLLSFSVVVVSFMRKNQNIPSTWR